MGKVNHHTIPIQVWVDIDIGVMDMVKILNEIEDVRTNGSCQGTIGEDGPSPYPAFVSCTWTPDSLKEIQKDFDVVVEGEGWGEVLRKGTLHFWPKDLLPEKL